MSYRTASLCLLLACALGGCSREERRPEPARQSDSQPARRDAEDSLKREQRETLAKKAGRVTYDAAKGTGQVLKEAGKHVGRAAKEFGAGIRDEHRDDSRTAPRQK